MPCRHSQDAVESLPNFESLSERVSQLERRRRRLRGLIHQPTQRITSSSILGELRGCWDQCRLHLRRVPEIQETILSAGPPIPQDTSGRTSSPVREAYCRHPNVRDWNQTGLSSGMIVSFRLEPHGTTGSHKTICVAGAVAQSLTKRRPLLRDSGVPVRCPAGTDAMIPTR